MRTRVLPLLVGFLALSVVAVASAPAFAKGAYGSSSPSAVPSASPSAAALPSTGGKTVFTMGSLYDLLSPNPFKANTSGDTETIFLTYDQLFNFDQKTLGPTSAIGEYPPQKSADGLTWTVHIRPGLKWSDGVPLTAHDVAFTYNFIWHNKMSSYLSYLGDPASFTAPNDTTFVWKMKTPTLSPQAPPWIPILPEHIWAKYDGAEQKTIKEADPTVGSGPFVFDEWKPGQYWSLRANKDYWAGAPNIDEVVFRVFDNAEALKLGLENGEVDAVDGLPPNVFQSLQNQPNITTNETGANFFDNLAFNFEGNGDPSLHNLDVRQAIQYSIDKQALVDRVTLGYGSPGESFILPTYKQYLWEPTGSEVMGYDPAKAKQLLDEAGYVDTNGDGYRERPNGDPWSLEVLTISDLTYSVAEGKLITGWMNDVGIKTTIKTVSESKAYDLWYAQDFDMYIWAWGEDPDPNFTTSIFTTSQCLQWSDGCWSNPDYDKLWTEQHSTLDFQARKKIVQQLQQIVYQQVPEVVLLYEEDLQAYRNDRFTGFLKQPEPVGPLFFAFGPYSYDNIRPVSGSAGGTTGTSDNGSSALPWILLAVVVAAGVGLVMVRRVRSTKDVE